MKLFKLSITLMVVITFSAVGCGAPKLTQKDFPLIPRTVFTGDPDRMAPKISPDGTKLAWSAPLNGVLNIWVADVGKMDEAKPVTKSKERPLTEFYWGSNDKIVYYMDVAGEEAFHVGLADIKSGEVKDLTPGKGFRVYLSGLNPANPKELLIYINDRDPQFFDTKSLNLETGEMRMIWKGDGDIMPSFDINNKPVFGYERTDKGESKVYRYKNEKWELKQTIAFDDTSTTYPLTTDKSGKILYMQSGIGRDKSALYAVDLDTWEKKLLAQDDKADITDFLFDPRTNEIMAVSSNYERKNWIPISEEAKADIDFLNKLEDGDYSINDQTPDNNFWIVNYVIDNGPAKFYLYDRTNKSAKYLYSNRPELEKYKLSKMKSHVVKSRDGLEIVCFVSLPPWSDENDDGIPDQPVPMVLNVHGGPNFRETWGFDLLHQFLTNRGYAVMSLNYRGSPGSGKSFQNAGNGQWGGKIQKDLLDVTDWAIDQKIAIPDKVAIHGRSFGGFCTLSAMTTSPEKFACGVDVVGISNLLTYFKSLPPYANLAREYLYAGGDPNTPDGKKFLESISPINSADKVARPLLIGHGANDTRVSVAESEQFVSALQKKNIPVAFCVFPDEGHVFQRPENKNSFNAILENFLAKHLGGRAQPFVVDDFKGSTIEMKAGVDQFPGLKDLLPKPAPKAEDKKDK